MAQVAFSVRMDGVLKKEFDALCEDFGMNTTTAFNIFARTVVKTKKIPFEIQASSEYDKEILQSGKEAFYSMRTKVQNEEVAEMSAEEINSLISNIRKTNV